jgi:basic amino acid/polyamine antiporter, APA family
MTTLVRTLGTRDITLLFVGAVIGSGIFIVPGAVLRQVVESPGLALLVWLGGGILSLLGALTYAELGARNPAAGGLYVYIRDCFGPLPAFLYGWVLFFVIGSGSVATLAVAFSFYVGQLLPLSPWMEKAAALLMIAIVTAVNVRGARQSADLQNWTTAVKVGAILLISFVLLWKGTGLHHLPAGWFPTTFSASLASAFGVAMISVLWAYEGWQYSVFNGDETIDPQRTFPKAFLIGALVLMSLYMLANVAYLAALGPTKAAATDRIAATSVQEVLGPSVAALVTTAILISIFSAANSIKLTIPRAYYAMAKDGLFFKKLAEVHPRFRTPAFSVIAESVIAAILTLTGTFEWLLTYVVFAGWIFYSLAAACVFVYRKRDPTAELPYKVPGYPVTPLLFVLAGTGLVANTIYAQPKNAAVGIGIILIGLPAYWFWRSKQKQSNFTEAL